MEDQYKVSLVFKRRSGGWTRVDAAEHRGKKLGMVQDEAEKDGGQATQTTRTRLKILAFISRKFVQVIAWFVCTVSKKFSVYQTSLGSYGDGAILKRIV